MINQNNKYYIDIEIWPGTNAISASILEETPEGKKTVHITDDKQTIEMYKAVATPVSQRDFDALWR